MDKRAHIIASGRVQKAGFRIFVDRIAFEFDLNGMVRNLEDGTVEIIVEGPEEKLDEFSRTINIRKYPIRVDNLKTRTSNATGEFKDFDIIKDGRSDSDLEGKVDLGTVFLQDISTRQEDTTKAIKTMDSHIETMDSHLTHMDSNMGNRFDRLDAKYGEFGKTMKSVRKDTKTMASDIKVIRKEATRGRKKPATG